MKNEVSEDQIWQALTEIPDPEIPVVSLVEMGIVREVTALEDDRVRVTITPTFSGCPALHAMKISIAERLQALGIEAEVVVTLSPPWSTDWIAESALEKLRRFGIAPPPRHAGNVELVLLDVVACPRCGSQDTEARSDFGPTPCRALAYCHSCDQPFEHFKPL